MCPGCPWVIPNVHRLDKYVAAVVSESLWTGNADYFLKINLWETDVLQYSPAPDCLFKQTCSM